MRFFKLLFFPFVFLRVLFFMLRFKLKKYHVFKVKIMEDVPPNIGGGYKTLKETVFKVHETDVKKYHPYFDSDNYPSDRGYFLYKRTAFYMFAEKNRDVYLKGDSTIIMEVI